MILPPYVGVVSIECGKMLVNKKIGRQPDEMKSLMIWEDRPSHLKLSSPHLIWPGSSQLC